LPPWKRDGFGGKSWRERRDKQTWKDFLCYKVAIILKGPLCLKKTNKKKTDIFIAGLAFIVA